MPAQTSPAISDFKETNSGFRYLALDGALDLSVVQQEDPEYFPYLLDSSSVGPNGRYSLLFGLPDGEIKLHADGRLEVNGQAASGKFLDTFDEEFKRLEIPDVVSTDPALPFTGGWFIFLSYELVQETEPSLGKGEALGEGSNLPIAVATRIPLALIVDHKKQTSYVVAEDSLDSKQLEFALSALSSTEHHIEYNTANVQKLNEEAPEIYLDSIARTKRYIKEGDIFQANLSRLWQAEVDEHVTPFDIFHQLKQKNPAPFSGVALFGENIAIISSSPERLVSVRNNMVSTRPIAGTHPRGETPEADQELSQRLLRHPKERAEHIMLIDLERNDIGRVCEPGSVEVSELMALESYSHVHHIVSEVTGTLVKGMRPVDVIRAVFPGGTITGCPKVRCMEIIQELERSARGAYTGSMGYINRDGSMDLNILIRTLVQNGKQVTFRAGGGIVTDSEPDRELNETRAKAKGMLHALGEDV